MQPSRVELRFLKSHEMSRLATASKDGTPHVVPVIYALDAFSPVIAIDYGDEEAEESQGEQESRVSNR
ncbi:MAG: hypothetical protein ACYC7D_12545 [Nitrososphaerales archaeon]